MLNSKYKDGLRMFVPNFKATFCGVLCNLAPPPQFLSADVNIQSQVLVRVLSDVTSDESTSLPKL